MTDIESWKTEQAKLGEVSIRLWPLTLQHAVNMIELGSDDVALKKIVAAGDAELSVICADRFGKTGDVLVEFEFTFTYGPEDSREETTMTTMCINVPSEAKYVKGSWGKVYKPGRFHGGRTSLMARVSNGISSGKAFRGR